MDHEALKNDLAGLDANQQRSMIAFLVALQDSRDAAYRRRLAEKIDRPSSDFASLEDLDQRLKLRDSQDKN